MEAFNSILAMIHASILKLEKKSQIPLTALVNVDCNPDPCFIHKAFQMKLQKVKECRCKIWKERVIEDHDHNTFTSMAYYNDIKHHIDKDARLIENMYLDE